MSEVHDQVEWDEDGAAWRRLTIRLLAGVALFRVVFNAFYPLDVSGDEAYYWDWGRQLDWGYFSKPPLIGWTNGLLRWLGVDHPVGMRCFSTLLGTAGLWGVYLLMARMFTRSTGFWAVVALVATVGNAALNVCLTTDAWLMPCWVGALYSFWRYMEAPSVRWSLQTALFVGLGVLAKQMMLLFFPFALIFLLLERRALLGRGLTWLCAGVPLLFLLPSLIWNARNEWITFTHTGDHFSKAGFSIVDSLTTFGEFLGGQAGLMTPLLFGGMLWALVWVVRSWRSVGAGLKYLTVFALPWVGFLLFSFKKTVNPNWPLLFDVAGILLFAGVASVQGEAVRRWYRRAVWVGVVFTVLFYGMLQGVPRIGLDLTRVVPLREISGWSAYGERIGALHAGVPRPEKTMLIACGHRYYAAALAFYHPERPRVFHWHPDPKVNSQYDLWEQPSAAMGCDALVVVHGDGAVPASLAERFERVEKVDQFSVPEQGKRVRRYGVYLGVGWRDA